MKIINIKKAEENLGSYLLDTIQMFLDELPEKRKLIEEADNYEEMAYALHKFVGTFNIIGIEEEYRENIIKYENICLDEEGESLDYIKSFSLSFSLALEEELLDIMKEKNA